MAVCVRVSLCPQQPDGGAATTAPVVAHAAEVFVRRFRYFQQLPPAVVRRVLFAAEPLVLGADRPDRPLRLCEQGTVADAMFMLLQGTAWAHSTPSTIAALVVTTGVRHPVRIGAWALISLRKGSIPQWFHSAKVQCRDIAFCCLRKWSQGSCGNEATAD